MGLASALFWRPSSASDPSVSSITCDSLVPGWVPTARVKVSPPSSLVNVKLPPSVSDVCQPGTTMRPTGASGLPQAVTIARPGPTDAIFQSFCFTSAVRSRGADQVAPSSSLHISSIDSESGPVPAGTFPSPTPSGQRSKNRAMRSPPAPSGTITAVGLVTSPAPFSWITCSADQVAPQSSLRLVTRSISPEPASASDGRASAKASSDPSRSVSTDGMRYTA